MIRGLSPAAKLCALAALAALVSAIPGIALPAVIVVMYVWRDAGLAWTTLGRALRPLLWFLAPVAVFQVWALGLDGAARTVLAVIALVSAAELITATTRTADLLAAVTRLARPLARVGVSPSAVGFSVVFLMRLVPIIAAAARDIDTARRARGAGRNPFAVLAPLLIQTLRTADATAEALDARGYADHK